MLVVDTHTWLWWFSGDSRLSCRAREALDRSATIGVPAVCCWETAMLHATERIALDRDPLDWLDLALSDEATMLLPLTPAVAVRAVKFGNRLPRDPADRLIVATAVEHMAPLVTRDGPITASGLVETIW